ncbi:hypothetical protein CGRA01v4_00146 [Colletotrichum graminicola]|nr:hypothetical protein CGRA01v4_00146 [Colletotrichum graminicola]
MLKPCFSGGCLLAFFAYLLQMRPSFFHFKLSLRPNLVPSVPIIARHLGAGIQDCPDGLARAGCANAGCANEARAGADATSDGMPSFPQGARGLQGSDTTFEPARVPLGWFWAEEEAYTTRKKKGKDRKRKRKRDWGERYPYSVDNHRVPNHLDWPVDLHLTSRPFVGSMTSNGMGRQPQQPRIHLMHADRGTTLIHNHTSIHPSHSS